MELGRAMTPPRPSTAISSRRTTRPLADRLRLNFEGADSDEGRRGYDAFYEGIRALVMGSVTYEWVLAVVSSGCIRRASSYLGAELRRV